jgi:hypothetical protein
MKKMLIYNAIGALIGVFVVMLFIRYAGPTLIDKFTIKGNYNLLFYFLYLVTAFFLALLVHELGHLITGLLLGNQFELLVIGPLGVKRKDNHIQFYINKDIAFFGGVSATIPKVQSNENIQKFQWIIIAGPVCSLLFAM